MTSVSHASHASALVRARTGLHVLINLLLQGGWVAGAGMRLAERGARGGEC